MFSSMKWKFIIVYFLLVLIAMVIVGVFIVKNLENRQIESITNSMEQRIEGIIKTSSSFAEDNWADNIDEIQIAIDTFGFGKEETLYVVYNQENPIIIAASGNNNQDLIGKPAYNNNNPLSPVLLLKAFEGDPEDSILPERNEDIINKHLAYPAYSSEGRVVGILYMTYNLESVNRTINDSRIILTNATIFALAITVFLGFIIASSITEPIRDVTKKAEEMAMGDFDQFVEVKSDDEIGQLASMFNYLTLKLKDTIQDMDLERSKLNTIFNYMTEGVVAINTKGSIIHANPIALAILGIGKEDVQEEKNFDLKQIRLDNINYSNRETLEGTEILNVDEEVYKVKYAPFNDEKNTLGGLIIVFQDITQEHKLDNMRKEFVANVSHELKTPITTIKSYTETLMENEIDKEVEKRFLQVIDSESDRMARLVRDLLQLSNIDYKKASWKKSNINIGSLLRDNVSKLHLLIQEKEQTVSLNIEEDLPEIAVDKDGIEQVILNIISNAIKYTDSKGLISINAYLEKSNIVIRVKDNGMGIPAADQERIFERFYRVEKGRSRDMGGTGLGLSIAKEITEAHGGSIKLESKVSEGTEITIKLPVMV